MHHEFEYELDGQRRMSRSSMQLLGESAHDTAMAKTVGLPLGILVRLLMDGEIEARGVHIPVMKEVYGPVLNELEEYGITFVEDDVAL